MKINFWKIFKSDDEKSSSQKIKVLFRHKKDINVHIITSLVQMRKRRAQNFNAKIYTLNLLAIIAVSTRFSLMKMLADVTFSDDKRTYLKIRSWRQVWFRMTKDNMANNLTSDASQEKKFQPQQLRITKSTMIWIFLT